jgi:hypothetical protein
MAKCNGLWNASSRSNKNAEAIHNICSKTIIRPNETRWNSTFDAIRQLLEFKSMFVELFKVVNIEVLSSLETKFLDEYIQAMTPVAYALDKLQGEKTFYFGYLAPVIHSTRKKLQGIMSEKKTFASKIAQVLNKSIGERFEAICEFDLQVCGRALFAAISFPYFKLRWVPIVQRDILKIAFINEAKKFGIVHPVEKKQDSACSSKNKDDNFFDFNDDTVEEDTMSTIELECIKYFNDESQEISSLNCYPTIKKIFEKYNTALASSAPVERAFSYGGLVLSPKRSRLSDEMLDMLVVLKVSYEMGF